MGSRSLTDSSLATQSSPAARTTPTTPPPRVLGGRSRAVALIRLSRLRRLRRSLAGLAAGALVLAPVGSRASLNFQESREKCPALGSTSNCLFVGPPAAARVQLQHAGRHAPSCATHPCHMHYMRCWSAGAHLPADNMRHSSQRMQLHC